jgi:hypothetical protein
LTHGSETRLDSRSSGIPRRLVMGELWLLARARSEAFERLAAALHMSPACFERLSEESAMDGDYVFLCGVMWCCYGQEDAGRELVRAAESTDPDLSALALAMLRERGHSLLQHTA